jgi:hypothetical protein
MATVRKHKREAAIAALLSNRTIKAAAAQCGMSYSALLVWLRTDTEFQAMYAAEKKSLLEGVKSALLQSAVSSVKVLQDSIDDEMESPLSRLPAVKFAIESAINIEISDAVLAKIDQPSKDEWDCIPSSIKSDEGEDAE